MTSTQLTCSVIICAYTEARWNDLKTAVASVRVQSAAPLEIIVVIDHNPALLARAQEQLAGVTLVENHQTPGLSGARNSGILQARGQVIAFLDDDAVATPNWLERLVACYADPAAVGAGGMIDPIWPADRPAWFPEEFAWVVGCSYRGMPETTAPVRNLIGANMSFRREVFAAVGGFRNGMGRVGTLPVGCEETELCIRVRQHWPERRFVFCPTARVHHQVSEERATWSYFHARCYAEGRSKAQMTRFVGARDGLASERVYTLRTLPSGIVCGLTQSIRNMRMDGARRAGAIIAGLAITTLGYLSGRLINAVASQPPALLPMNYVVQEGRD